MKLTAALLSLASLVCCGRHAAVGGNLADAAARDLGCSADQIELDDPTVQQRRLLELAGAPTQAYARGCGKRLVYAHMCKPDGSFCDWYSVKQLRIQPLLERAAFEMHCPKNQLKTRQLALSTVGITGCGQQGTYVWSCPHNQEFYSSACNWILNNTETRAASSAPR